MLVSTRNTLRSLTMVWLLACNTAWAASELVPAGMAVYTETARDIYVATLLLAPGRSLDNIYLGPGPKAMEYRIATRRISNRGFAGTLLLQAELGSGMRAPDTVIAALDQLKTNLKEAFKQGDRFVIALTENDESVFSLNNTELLRIADGTVFDFFFAGWVGATSSAILREQLLAGSIDSDTQSRYEALAPSAERVALVAQWNPPPPSTAVIVAVAEPAAKAEPPQVAATKPAAVAVAPTAAAAPNTAAKAPAESATAITTEPAATTAVAEVPPASAPAAEVKTSNAVAPIAVAKAPAAAAPAAKTAAAAPAPKTAAAAPAAKTPAASATATASAESVLIPTLDDREYQLQLGQFVSEIMQKIYQKVQYPRRAIEKSQQGKVELLAYFDENGELLDVELDVSSGFGALDKAADKAVRNAAPFPQFGQVAKEEFVADDGSNYVVTIPITFRLQ